MVDGGAAGEVLKGVTGGVEKEVSKSMAICGPKRMKKKINKITHI